MNKNLHLVKPAVSNWYKAPAGNLPVSLTPFIGRQTQVETLCQLLNTAEVRLVTLKGMAGLGKTRLSLAVGQKIKNQFRDGVFFVNLTPFNKPEAGLAAIAQILGVPDLPRLPMLEKLQNYLKRRMVLLILDNFEQIIELGSDIPALLAAAPQLKIIVTSRVSLHLYGEYLYQVAPLGVAELAKATSFEALRQNEAVTLFSQRASMVNPHFELTQENAETIARLCIYLEGLPLAIELAAARCDVFSPLALLTRLEAGQRFKVLTGVFSNVPARQRTLAGALEWSYQLLSEPEKLFFRRLSLFTGSFSLKAMAALDPENTSTLEIAISLQNKSLLKPVETLPDEKLRFTMLETIREYALEKLAEEGELEMAKTAHNNYFIEMVETETAYLTKPDHLNWLKRLEIDHPNILNTLNYLIEDGKVEAAFRLGGGIWSVWWQWGYLSQGRQWLNRILTLERSEIEKTLLARLLNGAAYLAMFQGDYRPAKIYFEKSLKIWRENGLSKDLGMTLSGLAGTYRVMGNYERALQLNYECLDMFRLLGEEVNEADSLCDIARQLLERGDYEQVQAMLEKSLAVYTSASNIPGIARAKIYLGDLLWRKNEPAQAIRSLEEAITLLRQESYRIWLPAALCQLGLIYLCEGQLALAQTVLEESIEIAEETHQPLDLSYAYSNLGLLKMVQNDLAGAESLFQQALNFRSEIRQLEGVLWAMDGLAALALKQSSYEAQQMMEEAQALRKTLNAPVLPHTLKFILPIFLDNTSLTQENANSLMANTNIALEVTPRLITEAVSFSLGEVTALSKRENEVLKLLAQGHRTSEIARILVVSPGTINNHLSSIYSKFEVSSRTAAIRFALDHSLL